MDEYRRQQRVKMIVQEIRGAVAWSINSAGDRHELRIELGEGQRRISMLSQAEYDEVSRQVQQGPKLLSTSTIGTLTFTVPPDRWEGMCDGVALSIYAPDTLDADEATRIGRRIRTVLRDTEPSRALVGERLYQTYVDYWCDKDDEPATRELFESSLRVTVVSVHVDSGKLSLELHGGELFGGHTILVTLDRSNQPTDVDL